MGVAIYVGNGTAHNKVSHCMDTLGDFYGARQLVVCCFIAPPRRLCARGSTKFHLYLLHRACICVQAGNAAQMPNFGYSYGQLRVHTNNKSFRVLFATCCSANKQWLHTQ